jgi:hypothetical protein
MQVAGATKIILLLLHTFTCKERKGCEIIRNVNSIRIGSWTCSNKRLNENEVLHTSVELVANERFAGTNRINEQSAP